MNQDDHLREAGLFVIDAPVRKICVYVNDDGDVVLMVEEDGERIYTACDYTEIPSLCAALCNAAVEAKPIAERREAEYVAFQAIEKAKGAL